MMDPATGSPNVFCKLDVKARGNEMINLSIENFISCSSVATVYHSTTA